MAGTDILRRQDEEAAKKEATAKTETKQAQSSDHKWSVDYAQEQITREAQDAIDAGNSQIDSLLTTTKIDGAVIEKDTGLIKQLEGNAKAIADLHATTAKEIEAVGVDEQAPQSVLNMGLTAEETRQIINYTNSGEIPEKPSDQVQFVIDNTSREELRKEISPLQMKKVELFTKFFHMIKALEKAGMEGMTEIIDKSDVEEIRKAQLASGENAHENEAFYRIVAKMETNEKRIPAELQGQYNAFKNLFEAAKGMYPEIASAEQAVNKQQQSAS